MDKRVRWIRTLPKNLIYSKALKKCWLVKTTLIFIVRPRYLVDYLHGDGVEPNGSYILSHHVHIVRPMTYATLCSICFYIIAALLLVRIESGIYGIPSIDMPDIKEVGGFISLLADKSLSQMIVFQLPYVAGIVISGCLVRLLFTGVDTPFSYLTSMYICGYFFGVSLLLVSLSCLLVVAIVYVLSSGNTVFVDYLLMTLITVVPFFILAIIVMIYVQNYRILRRLSDAGWFRCIVATTLTSVIFLLTMSFGILFMEI